MWNASCCDVLLALILLASGIIAFFQLMQFKSNHPWRGYLFFSCLRSTSVTKRPNVVNLFVYGPGCKLVQHSLGTNSIMLFAGFQCRAKFAVHRDCCNFAWKYLNEFSQISTVNLHSMASYDDSIERDKLVLIVQRNLQAKPVALLSESLVMQTNSTWTRVYKWGIVDDGHQSAIQKQSKGETMFYRTTCSGNRFI